MHVTLRWDWVRESHNTIAVFCIMSYMHDDIAQDLTRVLSDTSSVAHLLPTIAICRELGKSTTPVVTADINATPLGYPFHLDIWTHPPGFLILCPRDDPCDYLGICIVSPVSL